jgi:hypothetical protein
MCCCYMPIDISGEGSTQTTNAISTLLPSILPFKSRDSRSPECWVMVRDFIWSLESSFRADHIPAMG